jgi:hypothetical protein
MLFFKEIFTLLSNVFWYSFKNNNKLLGTVKIPIIRHLNFTVKMLLILQTKNENVLFYFSKVKFFFYVEPTYEDYEFLFVSSSESSVVS